MPIDYRTGDYRDLPGPFDFIVSSLVAHHMTDDQLDAFLRFMEAEATRGWLINDLHRHSFSYATFPLLARLLGAHRIVREDGQLSIARSFRPGEWQAILAEAGIKEARIVRRFPFRLCVERLR
jgi:2-polyprenyl-3-methyl-5-hydroxy-6-metoxy-1,4-benzoquinol methylase